MTALAFSIATVLCEAFTGQRCVLLVGATRNTEEWYGGQCEVRYVELQIGERWYETEPRRCP